VLFIVCLMFNTKQDDKSNDVQSVAVKCLGVLLKNVNEVQIVEIAKKLSSLVVDVSKDALRDIYSIGLKTLIADAPANSGPAISKEVVVTLVGGIVQQANENVKRESLDNLADLLRRFGHCHEGEHANIMAVVVKQLNSNKVRFCGWNL
jgi:cullin-associated NEDD8-dissociated protein 1